MRFYGPELRRLFLASFDRGGESGWAVSEFYDADDVKLLSGDVNRCDVEVEQKAI